MLRIVRLRCKKMFRERTEATLFQPGMVPVPVPVLSLIWNSLRWTIRRNHHFTIHSSSKGTFFHTWLIAHHTSSAYDSVLAEELWRRFINW